MARKKNSIKSFPFLWTKHEELYMSIFFEALQRLEINVEQRNENLISEKLSIALRKVCFNHFYGIRAPDWEKPIQPANAIEEKGGKVNKKPDFTCTLVNCHSDTIEMYEISLHVECKLLGATKGSWNLNKNYSNNGINRFDRISHEYGKRAPSGLMIGYIINMKQGEILEAVNNYIPERFPKLDFKFTQKVVKTVQYLNRNYVEPKDFKLNHLWVDLR